MKHIRSINKLLVQISQSRSSRRRRTPQRHHYLRTTRNECQWRDERSVMIACMSHDRRAHFVQWFFRRVMTTKSGTSSGRCCHFQGTIDDFDDGTTGLGAQTIVEQRQMDNVTGSSFENEPAIGGKGTSTCVKVATATVGFDNDFITLREFRWRRSPFSWEGELWTYFEKLKHHLYFNWLLITHFW